MPDPTESPYTSGIIPRADGELPPGLTAHQRFEPEIPRWTSYATQRHLRDIDVDLLRGWMWMATWGGVLCWEPDVQRCVRHTSAHGLIGNATRSLAVDRAGIVWAGGQSGGLCSLSPDDGSLWQSRDALWNFTVLRLAPRPDDAGGAFAALRHDEGWCALGELIPPDFKLRTVRGGLATREIEALLVDEDKVLWLGNAWGIHYQRDDGKFVTLEPFEQQVRALAPAIGRGLWVGTDQGVFRYHPDWDEPRREDGWPQEEVVSLTLEPVSGNLWVATSVSVGRIVDNTWLRSDRFPPGLLNELLSANPDPDTRYSIPTELFREDRTWAGGAGGLYDIGVDEYRVAFTMDAEDLLSNAVQCLWVDETDVWVGTVRGLYRFDGQTWHGYEIKAPDLRDVRALCPGRTNGTLWAGSWRSGLHRLQFRSYVPDQPLRVLVVALAMSGDGTQWAATPDEVYWRPSGHADWVLVDEPARSSIDGPVIQTICAGGDELWVGTSAGLWRYRPDLSLWYPPPEEHEPVSVQALAVNPLTEQLWVGTAQGLFSAHDWQNHRVADVRALAFEPAPEGTLWLGTSTGLERWPASGFGDVLEGAPDETFTASESGLAADAVTALAVRALGDVREVWAGSPAGVSCYRYTP